MDTTLSVFAALAAAGSAVLTAVLAKRQEQQARASEVLLAKLAKRREQLRLAELAQSRALRASALEEALLANRTSAGFQAVFAPLSKKERRIFDKEQRRMHRREAQLAKKAARSNAVGPRIRLIGALLPVGDEWRVEEMMNHRNELREKYGRVPLFHYARLFLSALEIRWEARVYPERRVE